MQKLDRDIIIKEIQRIASKKKVAQLTLSEFCAETGISKYHVNRLFDGWREACKLAGLEPYYQNVSICDDDLFEEMRRVFLNCSGVCTATKFVKLSKYDIKPYRRRFGKWQEILLSFRQWLENRKIEFSFIDELPPLDADGKDITTNREHEEQKISGGQHWQSIGGTTYGPPLNFRGLQHAPHNEQGVVLLFGIVFSELGFVVETMGAGYPDCEAKRRVDKKGDKWERVRIEFEFKSSHFRAQGHKPDLCNVIVCWEHDWLECPLEVIELKSAIEHL